MRFQAKLLYCRAAFSDCRCARSGHSVVAAQQLTSRFSQPHCCWPNCFSVVFVLPLALNLVLSTPFTYLLDCMKESPRLKLVTGQVENHLTQGRNTLGTQMWVSMIPWVLLHNPSQIFISSLSFYGDSWRVILRQYAVACVNLPFF